MTKYVWPLATSALVTLMGFALLVLPFALHTNAGGWTHTTDTLFWSGIGVAVIGLLSLWGWLGGLRKEMVDRGLVKAPAPTQQEETPAAPPADNLDAMLRPLAETVLRDLTAQLAAKNEAAHRGGTGA
ncbi:hypothetical protein [Sulfobacillus harzensis]|uniref:Uncharacterized protein n=1 Tax=Sulfobacillus harzensis TaxID=2729629 RepID=A0A7Y0Q385_9FIRM|nr:hypothetical protein [Sulfobacillus harzensis]NMP23297.1 hypothetical protein [Sulfobacillus harzensis]